ADRLDDFDGLLGVTTRGLEVSFREFGPGDDRENPGFDGAIVEAARDGESFGPGRGGGVVSFERLDRVRDAGDAPRLAGVAEPAPDGVRLAEVAERNGGTAESGLREPEVVQGEPLSSPISKGPHDRKRLDGGVVRLLRLPDRPVVERETLERDRLAGEALQGAPDAERLLIRADRLLGLRQGPVRES